MILVYVWKSGKIIQKIINFKYENFNITGQVS